MPTFGYSKYSLDEQRASSSDGYSRDSRLVDLPENEPLTGDSQPKCQWNLTTTSKEYGKGKSMPQFEVSTNCDTSYVDIETFDGNKEKHHWDGIKSGKTWKNR